MCSRANTQILIQCQYFKLWRHWYPSLAKLLISYWKKPDFSSSSAASKYNWATSSSGGNIGGCFPYGVSGSIFNKYADTWVMGSSRKLPNGIQKAVLVCPGDTQHQIHADVLKTAFFAKNRFLASFAVCSRPKAFSSVSCAIEPQRNTVHACFITPVKQRNPHIPGLPQPLSPHLQTETYR